LSVLLSGNQRECAEMLLKCMQMLEEPGDLENLLLLLLNKQMPQGMTKLQLLMKTR
jgi:hypothetical protein